MEKKAKTSNEANEGAVQAAQEHAIPEMVIENYQIKAQQTKIIQRMLIDIHKERRKEYWLQKAENSSRMKSSNMRSTTPGLRKKNKTRKQ